MSLRSFVCILGYAFVSTIMRWIAGDGSLPGTLLQLAGSGVIGWYCAVVDTRER